MDMNAQRRKSLEKVEALIAEARSLLDEVVTEEKDAYDNMPESLQNSERGETMYDNLSQLEDMVANLEEAEDTLVNVRNG
jgi:hypothetical protein